MLSFASNSALVDVNVARVVNQARDRVNQVDAVLKRRSSSGRVDERAARSDAVETISIAEYVAAATILATDVKTLKNTSALVSADSHGTVIFAYIKCASELAPKLAPLLPSAVDR